MIEYPNVIWVTFDRERINGVFTNEIECTGNDVTKKYTLTPIESVTINDIQKIINEVSKELLIETKKMIDADVDLKLHDSLKATKTYIINKAHDIVGEKINLIERCMNSRFKKIEKALYQMEVVEKNKKIMKLTLKAAQQQLSDEEKHELQTLMSDKGESDEQT